jgi:hypothetical protein
VQQPAAKVRVKRGTAQQHLLDSAQQLFAERGYRGTTLLLDGEDGPDVDYSRFRPDLPAESLSRLDLGVFTPEIVK